MIAKVADDIVHQRFKVQNTALWLILAYWSLHAGVLFLVGGTKELVDDFPLGGVVYQY